MHDLIDILRDSLPYDRPRREGKLVEDPELPYHWLVEHWYVDCDHPELSFPYYLSVPGPCSERRARWLAFELGFNVNPRERSTCLD